MIGDDFHDFCKQVVNNPSKFLRMSKPTYTFPNGPTITAGDKLMWSMFKGNSLIVMSYESDGSMIGDELSVVGPGSYSKWHFPSAEEFWKYLQPDKNVIAFNSSSEAAEHAIWIGEKV